MSLHCHAEVRGINVTCRDFQCHELSAGSQQCSCCLEPFPNALESGKGAPVLPGSLVASAGLSCVSLLSQLPVMHAVHFIFQTALIPEECFLFQTSPFLCDKETYFFFFFLLTRLCSVHSSEGNFTNSPSVRWQHNYHLTWQLFPWILNIQNTFKGTGGIWWCCCLLLRSVEHFWKGKGFLPSQGRHSTTCRWQLSDEKGFGKYYQI